jgi:hypothetical protein
MIVDYIDSHRESFGVEPVCAVLAEAGIAIAPSTYYARSKAPLTDAELADAYLATSCGRCGRTTGVSTAPGSCGMRLAAPATTSAATRWPG